MRPRRPASDRQGLRPAIWVAPPASTRQIQAAQGARSDPQDDLARRPRDVARDPMRQAKIYELIWHAVPPDGSAELERTRPRSRRARARGGRLRSTARSQFDGFLTSTRGHDTTRKRGEQANPEMNAGETAERAPSSHSISQTPPVPGGAVNDGDAALPALDIRLVLQCCASGLVRLAKALIPKTRPRGDRFPRSVSCASK